jgi:muskelin
MMTSFCFPHPTSTYPKDLLGRDNQMKLDYDIIHWSSSSSGYAPERIKVDNPTDQSSRWQSISKDNDEYLILRLERPAIVNVIHFGKFHRSHVCTVKTFRVELGMAIDDLRPALFGNEERQ